MLFSLANLPYWIFLGAGIVLFLVVILSGGGDDDLDLDAEVDADVAVEVDAEVDADADGTAPWDWDTDLDGEGSGLSPLQLLSWFGVGRTPLMLLLAMDLTLWGLVGWVLNVAIAEALSQPLAGWVALGIFLGSLTVALWLGSVLSRPIGKIFAAFGEDVSSDRLVGCLGTVTSAFVPPESAGKIGQVDVKDAAANFVTVSAKLPDWATISLRRGAKVLVIERSGGYYLVIARDSIDQERWLSGKTPT
ncbi:OB-fold-containig protein [Halomicronema sp. CCY15110]|uniref:OB-fold-containig protein n=1 Tax=Halomicronema sp. CCY15110 TaxID=2767773 RepID=UPI0019511723|nr:OB-fold-containig protein [Halomicronema sp. CCY15110]